MKKIILILLCCVFIVSGCSIKVLKYEYTTIETVYDPINDTYAEGEMYYLDIDHQNGKCTRQKGTSKIERDAAQMEDISCDEINTTVEPISEPLSKNQMDSENLIALENVTITHVEDSDISHDDNEMMLQVNFDVVNTSTYDIDTAILEVSICGDYMIGHACTSPLVGDGENITNLSGETINPGETISAQCIVAVPEDANGFYVDISTISDDMTNVYIDEESEPIYLED